MPKTITVDLDRHEGWDACLEEISIVIKNGGLLVFPTETFYGLGCNGLDTAAIKKVFDLKARPPGKPLLLLIADMDQLRFLAKDIHPRGERLMNAFWPGPLTLIFYASEKAPQELCAGTGKIGLRIPGRKFTRELIEKAGVPLVGTSANISGESGALDIKDIRRDFGDRVSLYLDAGKLAPEAPSTVLDLTTVAPVILREGKITRKEIENFW